MSAVFSSCRTWRYSLGREVDPLLGRGTLLLLGVNPSDADEETNDQTIRKDMGFCRVLGFARITKGNLFAYCSKDIRGLRDAADPIGPDNDEALRRLMGEADAVVACWGPTAKVPRALRGRWREVTAIAAEMGVALQCFGTAKDGQPLHTLTLSYRLPLRPWVPPLD